VLTCVGWQVTLCDPIWQVTLRSCEMDFHKQLYTALPFFTRVHSQHTQPYNTTARPIQPSTMSSTTHHQLTKKQVPTLPVALLSNSTLKAVVEYESTQSAMIGNNWEKNLLLFRHRTAVAKDQLL